uniref:Epsin 3 n=1 Tax=Takifugu rubripes TaxID=31033 RepID=H2SKM1_TAKRU
MTTAALRRQVKNIVHNYSEAEIKVREATSNDPWGPSSSLMSEIADLTFNVVAFAEVMGMVWKRLNDSGKNWRHVYKALTLLDYLLKTGSERVAQQCCENAFTIQTLRDFQYVDRDGRDQGANVREKARQLVCLLRDEERLHQERSQALKTKERMAGGGSRIPPSYHPGRRTSQPSMAVLYGEELSRSRGSPSSFNSSSSSPRAASDLEQARPQTSGEEELQLQLALAMSREESQKSVMRDLVDIFDPAPQPDDLWDAVKSPGDVTSDPWDSVGVCRVTATKVNADPFTAANSMPDPFGEDPLLSPQINGQESSPEMSDLSRLAPPLSAPSARLCRTPEAFLGPTGASLVNLDALIPSNPPTKMHKNPFLSGFSTPSPTNPFHCDHPRLTLNQMRSSSTSPLPPHMVSYSPSLPLPLPPQPSVLPSSLTQPSARTLDLPSNLPRPLLPLSPRSASRSESLAQNHNPFL